MYCRCNYIPCNIVLIRYVLVDLPLLLRKYATLFPDKKKMTQSSEFSIKLIKWYQNKHLLVIVDGRIVKTPGLEGPKFDPWQQPLVQLS